MHDGARRALVGLLAVLVAAWAFAAWLAVQILDAFDYGNTYDPWWRVFPLVAVVAAPWVVLARSGWRRVGLAYGVFLLGAVVFFGLCFIGA